MNSKIADGGIIMAFGLQQLLRPLVATVVIITEDVQKFVSRECDDLHLLLMQNWYTLYT